MELYEYCDRVGAIVKSEYGLDDGRSLCWNLCEQGVISKSMNVAQAAAIVAQHMEQA